MKRNKTKHSPNKAKQNNKTYTKQKQQKSKCKTYDRGNGKGFEANTKQQTNILSTP